jgi:hypothetical protein
VERDERILFSLILGSLGSTKVSPPVDESSTAWSVDVRTVA